MGQTARTDKGQHRMTPMPLVFTATYGLAGNMRSKAFPADQLEKRLKCSKGWMPMNVQITCFDTFADSRFGSFGGPVVCGRSSLRNAGNP